jgi:hypothetical protein
MVAWQEDRYSILNGIAQDEAEPKQVRSLATSKVAGRMKFFF